MIRSRCNMLENNEKPSKISLHLEKAKNNIKSMKSLKINNKLTLHHIEILEHEKKVLFFILFNFVKWYKQRRPIFTYLFGF